MPWGVQWKQDQALIFPSQTSQVVWAELCFFSADSSLWGPVSQLLSPWVAALKDLNQPGKYILFFCEPYLSIKGTEGWGIQ